MYICSYSRSASTDKRNMNKLEISSGVGTGGAAGADPEFGGGRGPK